MRGLAQIACNLEVKYYNCSTLMFKKYFKNISCYRYSEKEEIHGDGKTDSVLQGSQSSDRDRQMPLGS